jgi:hypothetical protein
MASAKISFEIEGKSHTLYFGMASVRIFQERSAAEYLRLIASGIEEPTSADLDPTKTLAMLVHSGRCNQADIEDEQRPAFPDSYELAEQIAADDELCQRLNEVWGESQPVKNMLERLKSNAPDGEPEKKSSSKPKTGKKLKPTPAVS